MLRTDNFNIVNFNTKRVSYVQNIETKIIHTQIVRVYFLNSYLHITTGEN